MGKEEKYIIEKTMLKKYVGIYETDIIGFNLKNDSIKKTEKEY